ncbi:CDGSH iron-sulfur domain-containing protein [Nonomuraea sp. ZG12]|uniref:CDGSH iron-sulfur domain-containing protein n=1 Tax=Nonomuraea sp. ZG12 TaxID=3452207 RepID=UPI003F8A78E7
MQHDRDEPVTVTPYEDGPLLLRGPFELRTPDGKRIDCGRSTVALCRCGHSSVKPFCDGSHKLTGFRATCGTDGGPEGEPGGETAEDA